MNIKIIFIAALLMAFMSQLVVSAESAINDDPIIVRLAGNVQRIPLYMTHPESIRPGFDANYCDQLEKVLQFDLANNGMTYLLPYSKDKDRLANAHEFDQGIQQSDWKAIGAFYVVKMLVQDKKISVRLFAANAENAKSINDVTLSGNLAQDRRQIHQIADTIFKSLFGSEGVATTRILYTVKTKQGSTWNSDIWEADYDGANARQITKNSGYAITPSYIPPKQGFSSGTALYVSYETGQPKICYQSIKEGSSPVRLTLLRGNQLMPTINRQRTKIAFISDVTGNPDLFLQDFNPENGAVGKPYQIFSTHLATQGTPTFSPDGKQIAFVSNKDGSPRIYVMPVPAPGTSLKEIKATLVTKRNKESSAPSWSPDGTKIAYCSMGPAGRQVWVYDFKTREERQITQGSGNKENPTWAPNSLHIVFNSSDAGASDLYLINLNQPEAVKITSGAGEKRFPSWEPRY